MRLDGKVALVTGASRGIGRAIAVRLGRDGAAVVVNYSGNHKAARETVAAIEAASGRAVAVQGDVGKVGDIQRLFDAAFEHFGKLDILVNNAGIMFNKPVADVTEEEYDRIFAVNVKGTFFACQQAAKRMADGGRIINFSSSTTAMMLPTYGTYVATKGAVEQIVAHPCQRSLAKIDCPIRGQEFTMDCMQNPILQVIKAKYTSLERVLDERARRLWAGAEARAIGRVELRGSLRLSGCLASPYERG